MTDYLCLNHKKPYLIAFETRNYVFADCGMAGPLGSSIKDTDKQSLPCLYQIPRIDTMFTKSLFYVIMLYICGLIFNGIIEHPLLRTIYILNFLYYLYIFFRESLFYFFEYNIPDIQNISEYLDMMDEWNRRKIQFYQKHDNNIF